MSTTPTPSTAQPPIGSPLAPDAEQELLRFLQEASRHFDAAGLEVLRNLFLSDRAAAEAIANTRLAEQERAARALVNEHGHRFTPAAQEKLIALLLNDETRASAEALLKGAAALIPSRPREDAAKKFAEQFTAKLPPDARAAMAEIYAADQSAAEAIGKGLLPIPAGFALDVPPPPPRPMHDPQGWMNGDSPEAKAARAQEAKTLTEQTMKQKGITFSEAWNDVKRARPELFQ